MSGEPSFTDFLRAADDSDLDTFEMRYLWRVWRRGACWESVRKTHETTGMSIGKVSAVRQSLLAKGWLTQSIEGGRVVFKVAIPDVVSVHTVNTVHTVNSSVHVVNGSVHVVDALPLIEQQEDYPIKYVPAPGQGDAPSPADPELIAAREATFSLIVFWEELTKRRRPGDDAQFREKWVEPFNQIWIACGRNVDAAKAKVQAVRASILAGGGRIFDPSKLPAHVQALVDVELLPMTAALNGNGHSNGRVNFRNDPEAREAHNRAVFAQVAAEYESGEWTPWTV